jgi:acetyl esterase/lipase
MGSVYFYLEPLVVLFSLLKSRYHNPAVFSLEYSLAPDACYPTQLRQAIAGYRLAISRVSGDASRICVAGDSAGGMLILSLLLYLAKFDSGRQKPGYAGLLSPWTNLVSENNRNTPSDYLDGDTLRLYASQYAGSMDDEHHPLVSPGDCSDVSWWAKATPLGGFYITYGSEEAFAPDIRHLVAMLRKAGAHVRAEEEPCAIHAWVIASLFLKDTLEDRAQGMKRLANAISENIGPA